MTSLLSLMGLGGPAIPDPAAFKHVLAENSNMIEVMNMIRTTQDKINVAIYTANEAGLSKENIDVLEALSTEAQNLQTANLGSAATAAKLADIEKRLAVAINDQQTTIQNKRMSEITTLQKKIEKRVEQVKKDTLTSEELKKEYEKLLLDVNEAVKSGSDPKYNLQNSMNEFNERLIKLDLDKDDADNKVFNYNRLAKRIIGIMMYGLTIIAISLGALFGGIVMSNAYADEYFWGMRFFYFLYGAALFPLSLIYGILHKPYWVAGIFPTYSIYPVVGYMSAPPLPDTLKGPTSNDVKAMLQNSMKRATQHGGADSMSITQRLFGYSVINGNMPTLSQVASQDLLQKICYLEVFALAAVSTYYGVNKYMVFKNS